MVRVKIVRRVFFPVSGLPFFIQAINEQKESFQQIIDLLTKLIFFVTKTEETDPVKCEGIPNRPRQKLMRELKVIEALTDILYYPVTNRVYDQQTISVNDPYHRICVLCYRLIKHAAKDYRINELYAAQWIDLYFMQAMRSKNENNLKAAPTIADLVKGNKRLLEEEITSDTIAQFIELLTVHKKHERYVILLTALCSCGDEAIMNKQNDIIQYLLENEKNRSILILPIRGDPPDQPVVMEVLCNEQWHDVHDFR